MARRVGRVLEVDMAGALGKRTHNVIELQAKLTLKAALNVKLLGSGGSQMAVTLSKAQRLIKASRAAKIRVHETQF